LAKIILIISVLFCTHSIAANSFYTVSLFHLENKIYSEEGENLDARSEVLNISFTKPLSQRHHLSISMLYANSSDNELRNGNPNQSNYSSNGIQEPQISYDYYAKSEAIDDGEVLNFKFSLIPALMEKRSGGNNSNQAIGGNFISYEALWGQSYKVWSGYIRFSGARNFNSLEKNEESKTEYSSSGYSTYSLNFLGRYKVNKKWSIFFSSGVQFVRDIDVQSNKKTSSTLIQQGTGTTRSIGVSYSTLERRYSSSIKLRKNDFFIDDGDGNYSGEFERCTLNLSVTFF
jgi:hypothetical protein